ncbi:MAG: hypothetical protein ACR2P3_06350 [Geminicoccaceae bacterium]
MSADYQQFSASDKALYEAIDACIRQKKPFKIVADGSFRHRKPLQRMLRSAAGEKERRGFLRSMFDAYVTADVMACLGLAANDEGYLWDFEVSADAVTIAFDPPVIAGPDPLPS